MKNKLKIGIKALEQISTGSIKGEGENYKDTLYICRQIAQEALNKLRI